MTTHNDTNLPEAVVIRVHLNEHLVALQVGENTKPLNERKRVPTRADLARATGLSRTTIYKWSDNDYQSTRHDVLEAVINKLRELGFQVTVSDLLKEHPISTVEESR